MKTLPLVGALALFHLATAAGPIAPVRYIDAQGVEVIHDRGAPGADAISTVVKTRMPVPVPVPASGAAASPKLTIAPAEQAARDRDRVAILEQELDRESHAYADVWTKLNPPARTPRPAPEATPRMNEQLNEQLSAHQKNIQALHAELRRARAGR